jgi:hypothetical protein
MRLQTMMFTGLVIAMAVLLAFAWYTWPQQPSLQQTSSATTAAASSTVPTSTTSTATSTSTTPQASYPPPVLGEHTGVVRIDGQTIYVDLAQDPPQQTLGLGNRQGLGASQGMLFIFPNDAQHMFWMKDMSFSIDMVWLSADGTVIYIQPNAAPDTYPQTFGPNQDSRYVLEVPANFATGHGVKVGDQAILP